MHGFRRAREICVVEAIGRTVPDGGELAGSEGMSIVDESFTNL